jgi:hypothetical protein
MLLKKAMRKGYEYIARLEATSDIAPEKQKKVDSSLFCVSNQEVQDIPDAV